MNGADDRQILLQIVFAALGSALIAHGGDTTGKKK
jgi:hypothetical protein